MFDRLERRFGRPSLGRRLPPLDELALTILSQSTNDRNRDVAYAALRRAWPRWRDAAGASPAELEAAIRPAGLARAKSRALHGVLQRLRRRPGGPSLGFLRRMETSEARAYLRSFPGVGPKTAACVLLFACGHGDFPVDVHVHRVARRLGWVPRAASAEKTYAALLESIPAGRALSGHLNLIALGRSLCRPRQPRCPACPLRRGCRHAAARGRS